jgi:carbonic anhydrase/acetyltransferase-like protein (isoleucine patch superfamily)
VTVRSFDGRIPRIGEGSYVHPSADVFGKAWITHVDLARRYPDKLQDLE